MVSALLAAIPGLISIAVVLMIFYYAFAVIAANLFIAIIVNAMQSFSEAEHQETVQALDAAGDHSEGDLQRELQSLRGELGELKRTLAETKQSRQSP